jgi:hypothetical protein
MYVVLERLHADRMDWLAEIGYMYAGSEQLAFTKRYLFAKHPFYQNTERLLASVWKNYIEPSRLSTVETVLVLLDDCYKLCPHSSIFTLEKDVIFLEDVFELTRNLVAKEGTREMPPIPKVLALEKFYTPQGTQDIVDQIQEARKTLIQ